MLQGVPTGLHNTRPDLFYRKLDQTAHVHKQVDRYGHGVPLRFAPQLNLHERTADAVKAQLKYLRAANSALPNDLDVSGAGRTGLRGDGSPDMACRCCWKERQLKGPAGRPAGQKVCKRG